ncbi:MAG TPA: hypothetical protein VIS48_03475 [Candidatus Kryptonia bacterium]
MRAHLFVAAIYDPLTVPADKLGFEQVGQMVREIVRLHSFFVAGEAAKGTTSEDRGLLA